jgi:hypothetical protein
MVIFIVAINAFNAYAQYSAIENYNMMVGAYKAEIRSYCPDLEAENIALVGDKIEVKDETSYIYFTLTNDGSVTEENKLEYVVAQVASDNVTEYVVNESVVKNADVYEEIKTLIDEDTTESDAMRDYFVGKAQDAVKRIYNDEENGVKNKTKFLWIKNIWMTDASYKHPVPSYADFSTEAKRKEFNVEGEKVSFSDIGKTGTIVYSEEAYNSITAKLTEEKSQANGFYVLIVLSIGTILLQQFVMMRSQKEHQKFSTVDGQCASQQKMMMIMMTGMFAMFSFMYSSAFSIYMITSNIFSLLSTLVINQLVDRKLAKEDATATVIRMDNRTLSRIEAAKNAGKESAKGSKNKKSK